MQLQEIDSKVKFDEVGTVLQVSDGVARIYGLQNAESGELLEFDNGMKAVVMNLEEDNVGAVLLGPTDLIKEGFTVKRTSYCVYPHGRRNGRKGCECHWRSNRRKGRHPWRIG
jgi:F0F1-type ATP synthase alpha subunit